MRRAIGPLVLLGLTGTLLAQTPASAPVQNQASVWTDTLIQSTGISTDRSGASRMKQVSFTFANGVTVHADEALISHDRKSVEFSGKTRMTIR